MPHPPAWFERTFAFGYPVELLPNLLARLRGTPARLEDLLAPASASALHFRADEAWSAQENAGHLLDLEPLWLARVEDFVRGAAELTPTDLQNRRTFDAHHNDRPLAALLSDFRAARERLLARVAELSPEAFTRAIPHPRLHTPMLLTDHLFFVAEHDDHHLARIWTLLH